MIRDFLQVDIIGITPCELKDILMKEGCRKNRVKEILDICLERYVSCFASYEILAEEAGMYIVYILVCVLNEIETFMAEKMDAYLNNPEVLLNEIINISKSREWYMDKHKALGLCVHIIKDYLMGRIETEHIANAKESAIEWIINSYPDYIVDLVIDPVWELFKTKLLAEYDDNIDVAYAYNDILCLENIVKNRKGLKPGYNII